MVNYLMFAHLNAGVLKDRRVKNNFRTVDLLCKES